MNRHLPLSEELEPGLTQRAPQHGPTQGALLLWASRGQGEGRGAADPLAPGDKDLISGGAGGH